MNGTWQYYTEWSNLDEENKCHMLRFLSYKCMYAIFESSDMRLNWNSILSQENSKGLWERGVFLMRRDRMDVVLRGLGNNRAWMTKWDWGCGERESGSVENEVVTKVILTLIAV